MDLFYCNTAIGLKLRAKLLTTKSNIPLTSSSTRYRINKKHSKNADTSTSVTFDLELTSRSRNVTSLDVAYSIVPWFQV